MTEEEYEEYIKIERQNEIILKLLKPAELLIGGITISFDYKFIKDVYSLSYISHIDYLSLPTSKIYLGMLIIGLAGYVGMKCLEEYLYNENLQIQDDIKKYNKIKKLVY